MVHTHMRSFCRDMAKTRADSSTEHRRAPSLQWTSAAASLSKLGAAIRPSPPPDPAPSKRHSDSHSIYATGANPPLDARPLPALPSASTPSIASTASPPTPPAKLHSSPPAVKIRDFAFTRADARHTGRGAQTPAQNLRLLRRPSAWFRAEDEGEDEPPVRAFYGWQLNARGVAYGRG